MRNLFPIAVKYLRVEFIQPVKQGTGYAMFLFLRPPRMFHVWIDIGIETILLSRKHIPAGLRLFLDKINPDNRFDTLETVFSGDHQPYRRTILIWHSLAVHADCKKGQRIDSLVNAQAFAVGPPQNTAVLPRHLFRIVKRFERDVFCL